jgi:hypothetical protein
MNRPALLLAIVISIAIGSPAMGGLLITFTDVSGLAAEAEFTIIGPFELEVRYKNLSTGVPFGFSNSDQILSGVSWDFGDPGFNGDSLIIGGTATTGPTSASLNFDVLDVGANADVSGEFGYGNMDGTGALTNFVSSNSAQATPFGGANLDGPVNIDGPQGGLVASPAVIPLGGLGAIQNEVIVRLFLDPLMPSLDNLDFLTENSVRFEFGSDAKFFTIVPEPSSVALAVLAFVGLAAFGWRRRKR